MSLRFIRRLMFVLAAFAMLAGAMASPMRSLAAQAGVAAAEAGDCMAMKMPCPAAKSAPCKMAASDCAKMTSCCDALPSPLLQSAASSFPLGYIAVSYPVAPVALRDHPTGPAPFPPIAA